MKLGAYEAAREKGDNRISVDLNYRAKLWQYGVAPTAVMPGLVEYCDLVMGNLWAAEKMLGIPVAAGLMEKGDEEGGFCAACAVVQRRDPQAVSSGETGG